MAASIGEFERLLHSAGKSVDIIDGQYQVSNYAFLHDNSVNSPFVFLLVVKSLSDECHKRYQIILRCFWSVQSISSMIIMCLIYISVDYRIE